ncbi:MAG TPA: A/G-specific adenine glycosylase [Chitinophagaceae bacterium]|nr:A/G-specific adenine glycosylase [Chitinophagaceae bacterium]
MKKKFFPRVLMHWHYTQNKRQMPWKGEKDPYKVWLSEVILQQTRVEQGWAYFEKFVVKYPGIQSLAAAKDEEVFKLWEGLGYYSRCKNLLATAREIVYDYDGAFPRNYENILALKGIGTYTAAAISSFCFGLPYPVIDGNVLRVLARVFNIDIPIDSNGAAKIFGALAAELIDKKDPGAYNQAIMDFGATVCKPALPLCAACPMQQNCGAYKAGKVNLLPVKEKTLVRKTRWLSYFIFEHNNSTLIHKRIAKDIWQNLFEFYLVETPDNPKWDKEQVHEWLENSLGIANNPRIQIFPAEAQQLTHQQVKGYFIKVALEKIPEPLAAAEFQWLTAEQVKQLAFPRFINHNLPKNALQPELFNC